MILATVITSLVIGLTTTATCPTAPQQTAPQKPQSVVDLPVSVALYEPVVDEPVYYDVPLERPLQDRLFDLCGEYGVPVEMALAVMEQESRFQADVVSEGGDQGLFQINPVNNDWLQETLGLDDVMEPTQNIEAGIYMLSLFDYEDPHKRLMAYNCGIGRAKELWEGGITRTSYSEEVVERMKGYGRTKKVGKINEQDKSGFTICGENRRNKRY